MLVYLLSCSKAKLDTVRVNDLTDKSEIVVATNAILASINEKKLGKLNASFDGVVLPLYQKSCAKCHSEDLDTRDKWYEHVNNFCLDPSPASNCVLKRISFDNKNTGFAMPPVYDQKALTDFGDDGRKDMIAWLENTIQLMRDSKETIIQERTLDPTLGRGKTSSTIPELNFPPINGGGPPPTFMDGKALGYVFSQYFGSPVRFSSDVFGGFDLAGRTWVGELSQGYVQEIRKVIGRKCVDLASKESRNRQSNFEQDYKLVKANAPPNADQINAIMSQIFRASAVSGLHDGAVELAEAAQKLQATSIRDLYANLCVIIGTDPRTFIR